MTTDDLIGKPHLVILKSDHSIKVVEFTGTDAMEKAHAFANQQAVNDFPGCVTVAMRVRQLFPPEYKRLMS